MRNSLKIFPENPQNFGFDFPENSLKLLTGNSVKFLPENSGDDIYE